MKTEEIRKELEDLPGWVVNKGRLEKVFTFPNFARAAVFFNKIINPIEENQHYPQIFIAYNRVSLSLITVEEGRLTSKDFLMARALQALS